MDEWRASGQLPLAAEALRQAPGKPDEESDHSSLLVPRLGRVVLSQVVQGSAADTTCGATSALETLFARVILQKANAAAQAQTDCVAGHVLYSVNHKWRRTEEDRELFYVVLGKMQADGKVSVKNGKFNSRIITLLETPQ